MFDFTGFVIKVRSIINKEIRIVDFPEKNCQIISKTVIE